jgi:hypothetical protein
MKVCGHFYCHMRPLRRPDHYANVEETRGVVVRRCNFLMHARLRDDLDHYANFYTLA